MIALEEEEICAIPLAGQILTFFEWKKFDTSIIFNQPIFVRRF